MKDPVAEFEALAIAQGWRFAFGTKEILNWETSRKNLKSGETLLLMFPFVETPIINEARVIANWDISTRLWLGRKFDNTSSSGTYSKLDETYEQKYDRRLTDLRADMETLLRSMFCSGDYELQSARVLRGINLTPENLDFVMADVTFRDE
jgi:hypothetical protein